MNLKGIYKIRGFGLVEVMISACLIAVLSVFLYQAFFTSMNASVYAKNRLNAGLVLNNRLWEASINPPDSARAFGKDKVDNKEYNWLINSSLASGFKKIEIFLSWQDGKKNFKLSDSLVVVN